MPRGGPGRGQGRRYVRGLLRPYARREAIGRRSSAIGMRCVELRHAKPMRSRDDILVQVADEFKVAKARVRRCWACASNMIKDMREDSPVDDYAPDTRPRLSDDDHGEE